MRALGTDHVISGPIRGLNKNCIRCRRKNRHSGGHRNSKTESAQWDNSVKRIIATIAKLEMIAAIATLAALYTKKYSHLCTF